MKIFALYFLLCFFPTLLIGQNDSAFVQREGDFVLKPNFLFQNLNLSIDGAHGDIIAFEPGNTAAIGMTASYKWFVASLYYGVYNEYNNELKNKSTYRDFRFNFSKRHAGLDLNFQWFKGFSIKELPESVDPSLIEQLNPNLDLFTFGINFYYGLNKNLSIQSAYKYNELQKSSSGSVIVGLSQNYSQLNFTSNIFPDDIALGMNMAEDKNDGKFLAFIPTVGYMYNFVEGKYHCSPNVLAGMGVQYQDYVSEAKGNFKGINRAVRYNLNLPVGYNGNKVFFGAVGRYDNFIYYLERSVEIKYNLLSLKAYFGVRF